MKILLNNYENDLMFEYSCVNSIEMLNKKAFYQLLKDINNLNEQSNISFIENGELVNSQSKISIVYDYVNFDFDNKKIVNGIINLINENINEKQKNEINKFYKRLVEEYNKIVGDLDLKLEIQDDFSVENITKLLKVRLVRKDSLFDNLLLLIDVENELQLNKLLVFVNLKDYLESSELEEFYKYAIYKEVNLLLLDNNKHITSKFEKKLLIDDDLVEFVL